MQWIIVISFGLQKSNVKITMCLKYKKKNTFHTQLGFFVNY